MMKVFPAHCRKLGEIQKKQRKLKSPHDPTTLYSLVCSAFCKHQVIPQTFPVKNYSQRVFSGSIDFLCV